MLYPEFSINSCGAPVWMNDDEETGEWLCCCPSCQRKRREEAEDDFGEPDDNWRDNPADDYYNG